MNMTNETMGSINQNLTSERKHNDWNMSSLVSIAMAVWLGIVLVLGLRGAFLGSAGSPPLAIFFGVASPLLVYFLTYFASSRFKAFVLGADLRLLAAIQGWRWAGFGFLSLYAHGVLPALFALPAGLGDMAIGITAPWMVLGLIKNPSFVTSRRFMIWNIMGIVDLAVAVSIGAISSGFLPRITGNVTTSAMGTIPLVLIPAYLVPFFIMLHFSALAQGRRLAVRERNIK